MTKMLKEGQFVRLESYKRKVKSPFIIYINFFQSILVPDDSGKKNLDECFDNK